MTTEASTFTVALSRNVLAAALARIAPAIQQRVSLPVLSTVRFDLSSDGLSVSATNLDAWITVRIAKSDIEASTGSGRACIPGKRLADIVNALPKAAALTIAIAKNRAKVTAGRSKFEVAGVPSDEFPDQPSLTPTLTTSVDGSLLVDALTRAQPFAGTMQSVSDEVLRGANLRSDPKFGLLVECSDRARVARVVVDEAQSTGSVLLPASGVFAISTLFSAEPSLKLEASSTHARFSNDSSVLILRLIGGAFPASEGLDKLFSLPVAYSVETDARELQDAIRRVLLASGDNPVVIARSQTDALKISARGDANASAEEVIDATKVVNIAGKRKAFAINGRMLIDAIKSAKGERVRIEIPEQENAPFYVRAVSDKPDGKSSGSLFAIAPMRILAADLLGDEGDSTLTEAQEAA